MVDPLFYLFSATNREFCFIVTITDDIALESNEVFTVVARENPPFFTDLPSFSIQDDTVTVTVLDTDRKFIFYYIMHSGLQL